MVTHGVVDSLLYCGNYFLLLLLHFQMSRKYFLSIEKLFLFIAQNYICKFAGDAQLVSIKMIFFLDFPSFLIKDHFHHRVAGSVAGQSSETLFGLNLNHERIFFVIRYFQWVWMSIKNFLIPEMLLSIALKVTASTC